MPTFGGLAPFPRRYGGGTPALKYILDSLNRARGTAYDVNNTSNVYVENMAYARAIKAAWSTNQRLANILVPSRTSLIARWERIMGITPMPDDTDVVRRARIVERWMRVGVTPTTQSITDSLTRALGPVFVAVEHESIGSALVYWPGGSTSSDTPWFSTIARIVIHIEQPTGYTDADFYTSTGGIAPVLDARLSSWCTWVWYRNSAANGVKGFYLDDVHNLDNSVFDV